MSNKKLRRAKNLIEIPSSIDEVIRVRYNVKSKKCDSCGIVGCYKFYNNSYLCKDCFFMDRRGITRIPSQKR